MANRVRMNSETIRRNVPWAALVIFLAIWALFPLRVGAFPVYLATFVSIHVMVALGLNLFTGYCGQINFGPVAFYGVGAYATVLLQKYAGLHFFAALVLSLVICVGLALLVGLPILRLRHFVLALGTFAFAFIVYLAVKTVAIGVLGGDDGITAPHLTFWGKPAGPTFFYYLVSGAAILCFVVCHRLAASKIGRAWKAIRGDEEAAAAMGIDVAHYVRLAWLFNAVVAGLAGSLYGQWNGWVSPAPFNLGANWVFLLYIVVGGLGINTGALVGTVIMALIPEFVLSLERYATLVYAGLLFLVIRFMPRGIVGSLVGPTAVSFARRVQRRTAVVEEDVSHADG